LDPDRTPPETETETESHPGITRTD
jgi:hypothetical protein